ncbi:MAG: hypothetical protein AAF354_15140, partial [Pseudomonadota bacterium]
SFFQLMHEQVAKEVQRFCKSNGVQWNNGIFAKRLSIVPIEGGARIQRQRLKYLLAQGVKEGLVPHPKLWPGLNSAKALLGKMTIDGLWVDRSSLYEVERGLHRRKKKVTRKRLTRKQLAEYQHQLAIQLAPMPYQAEMTEAERQADIRSIIAEILEENAEKVAMAQRFRKQRRRKIMDLRKLALQPEWVKNDVEPLVHADGYGDKDDHTWRLWMLEWESWLNAYERASKRLRSGIKEALAEFPEGCFLPSIPQAALAGKPPP